MPICPFANLPKSIPLRTLPPNFHFGFHVRLTYPNSQNFTIYQSAFKPFFQLIFFPSAYVLVADSRLVNAPTLLLGNFHRELHFKPKIVASQVDAVQNLSPKHLVAKFNVA